LRSKTKQETTPAYMSSLHTWRQKLINVALVTGAIGSSVLAYAIYHNSSDDRTKLNEFQSATRYQSVDQLIHDLQTRDITEQMCKLRAFINTRDEPMLVIKKLPPSLLSSTSSNDDTGQYDDDVDHGDEEHVEKAALFHLHGEQVKFTKISPAPTETTPANSSATEQLLLAQAQAQLQTVTKRESQDEQYEYVIHGDLILCDKHQSTISNHEALPSQQVPQQQSCCIHINDPINLLYNTRLRMHVLSDDTLQSDPLFTEQSIVTRHLKNGEDQLRSSGLHCHTLTEIHGLGCSDDVEDGDAIDDDHDKRESNEEEEEESLVNESSTVAEHEGFIVEKQVFYNILRQVIPTNTRVFVYGRVRFNSELNRYELDRIGELSNYVTEWTLIHELWSDRLLSGAACFGLSGLSVSCFVFAAKRMFWQ